MNQNVISNIISRGGNNGWTTSSDSMNKSFEFTSFEQA